MRKHRGQCLLYRIQAREGPRELRGREIASSFWPAYESLMNMEKLRTRYGEIIGIISKDIEQLGTQPYNANEGQRNIVEGDSPSSFSRVKV